jgi:glycosyltransferase involved in cell wall biosynthesis
LDYPTFFKKIDKPIVWTLHDMNLFQGGFHYLDDQDQNANLFQELDQKIISLKHEALDHIPNLQIVCPSKWLKTASENAQLTSRFSHHHIYNGLDLNCFKPAEPDLLRRKYDLPQDKILLLFVSEKLGNKRKGFDLLLPAIQSMVHRHDVSFVAIGEIDQSLKESNMIELGYIQNEEKMAEIYAAADAVILPSREDNLPNVMLEAIACGTPVIAFPIGGIPEVVKTGHTGILAEEVSVEALKAAILSFADKKIVLDREKIRAFAVAHFDLVQQAKKYLEVYEQAFK